MKAIAARPSLSTEVASVIRREILAGSLIAGEHTNLLELTGNRRLLESFNRSVPVLRALIPLDESSYPSLSDVAQEHWRLVQAIQEGDEDAAARYAEEHVDDGSSHVVNRWLGERAEAVE
jgi:DNA-binding FadR family transcriptional regulator